MQEAAISAAITFERGQGWLNNLPPNVGLHCRRHDSVAGVCTHTSRIRPAIPVKRPLVIASRHQWHKIATVSKNNKGEFLALQRFFDEQPCAALSKFSLFKNTICEGSRLAVRFRDQHPFSTTKSISFENQGIFESFKLLYLIRRRSKYAVSGCCRYGVAIEELLRKDFTAFKLSALLGRSDYL